LSIAGLFCNQVLENHKLGRRGCDVGWHFLFPNGSTPDAPDEMFADQHAALTAAGFTASICTDSVLAGVKPLRDVPPGTTVVYRGWMTTAEEYAALVRAIERCEAGPLTFTDEYLAAHHLPNWYPTLADLTPETRVFPPDADLDAELRKLGWGSYFIKDFVKSLKTGRGSVVHDPAEAPAVVAELREYRGRIEGGICVRRVEEFLPESEQRYFVLKGIGYAATGGSVPRVVQQCAERVVSPFFSVDVARRSDGELRVVEIGDGQVSDLVGWSAVAFASLWRSAQYVEQSAAGALT
jgi:hypothetical protein